MNTPNGQLYDCERLALHNAVLRCKPMFAFEVGTWYGGGSTLQIANALRKNGRGKLVTCEPDFNKFSVASDFYDDDDVVIVYNSRACDILSDVCLLYGPPSFIFFDGSEEPQESLDDFMFLDGVVGSGTVFMMHDWITPKSHKADLLRPYLENLKSWRITNVLMPPASVGLVEAIKL